MLVTSRLDYCNALLHSLPHHMLGRLQQVRNTAARLNYRLKKTDHIKPALMSLHWLPVEFRHLLKILTVAFKTLSGLGPSNLGRRLCRYQQSIKDHSKHLLQIPPCRIVLYGNKMFSVAAVRAWNDLAQAIRDAESLNSFKKLLKTYFFRCAYLLLFSWFVYIMLLIVLLYCENYAVLIL